MYKIVLLVLAMIGWIAVDTYLVALSQLDFWFVEITLLVLCGIILKEEFSKYSNNNE